MKTTGCLDSELVLVTCLSLVVAFQNILVLVDIFFDA